jgi:hypothetical protein
MVGSRSLDEILHHHSYVSGENLAYHIRRNGRSFAHKENIARNRTAAQAHMLRFRAQAATAPFSPPRTEILV